MVASAVLGFPRIGPNREVKKAVEAYWAGKQSADELQKVAKATRLQSWNYIKNAGVDVVPSGDFSLYDHVLDASNTFNIIPSAYAKENLSALDTYFAQGRGRQVDSVDLPAQEMKKWFDSNYHFIVPEFSETTQFTLNNTKQVDEFLEAKAAGIHTRPVIVGPVTLLALGKVSKDSKQESFDIMTLLPKLVPVYAELFSKLAAAGADWIQVDEPVLVLDKAVGLADQFKAAYEAFASQVPGLKIMLTTYFSRLDSNLNFVKDLPVAGVHVDLDRAPEQLDAVLAAFQGKKTVVSLGLVSGRNVWKADLASAIALADKATKALGADRVVVATSSSLLHTPIDLENETKLKPEVKDWLSFAVQKAKEVSVIAKALTDRASVASELETNARSIKARREFETTSDSAVRDRIKAITPAQLQRASPFAKRAEAQKAKYGFPKFPTTTIGSFPQTKEIRVQRQKFNKKEISQEEYESFLEKEIETVVRFQEKIGLDVLVHGEPERSDMVAYFGEQLQGFAFTENGWVQSYGSRYVRPPIVVSDVSRPAPMTVRWSKYAQSITQKPMKGMLTGGVTILNWSFPRVDVPREIQAKQIALALRDEIKDLETAGVTVIQVDEPALREGLPLRQADQAAYLNWAVDVFKLATSGIEDSTHISSHFCYSDFNDIMKNIIDLDADQITIENSKSDAKLLKIFTQYQYPAWIGPGSFDIHSPRVPPKEEFIARIDAMCKVLPSDLLWVNPDCGLKTRSWESVEGALTNMVAAAQEARAKYV